MTQHSADALVELAAWFANAKFYSPTSIRQMIERKLAASPVRCWPHHFDLATLTCFPTQPPTRPDMSALDFRRATDITMSRISMYPYIQNPIRAALPTLPMFGHWHTHDFTAAIVPAHKIVATNNQKDEIDEFLRLRSMPR